MPAPETWVAFGFVIFVAVLGYLRVHSKAANALDQRQARIKSELDEARRLRDEAEALLAEFERKGAAAESEAAAIIAGAKVEAERLAAEAKVRMEDFVARRTKIAEDKIAQAEAQALTDVRSAAADAAVAKAEKMLASPITDDRKKSLLSRSIGDLSVKLNGEQSSTIWDAAE